MTTSSNSEKNKPEMLALRPLLVGGLVQPIDGDEGYDGGVGRAAFEQNLRITVPAWQMQLGDECRLYWRNVSDPIRVAIIDTADKLNKDVIFTLTGPEILDGPTRTFYTVTAKNQSPEHSPELKLLVKRTYPGGELVYPEPDGHPELRYRFEPDVSDGIDQDMVNNGIRLLVSSYPNVTIFDRIIARWGVSEEATLYPVTQRNVDDPTNHPIEVFFSKALIERAGKGTHSVTFQVIDRCGNYPHPNAPWAIPTKVTVNIGDNKRLPPPSLKGEDQGGIVDPTFLTDITVKVPIEGLNPDDIVRVNWQGRINRETSEKTYSGGETLNFPIPLEWARESDEREVTIVYKVRGAGPERPSEPKSVNIKTTIDPKQPKVLEAYGALGDRLKMADIYYAPHVTIEVPQYLGMAIGQTIRARWASERHVYDSAITTVQRVGPMRFKVPRLEVIDAIGTKVPVSYTVRNFPKGPLHRSKALPLAVDPQAFDLTAPRLTADRTRVTVRYPGMTTGYHARVRITGVETRETAWQELNTDMTAEFLIPRTWIDENEGKPVLINYSVNQSRVDENSQFSKVLRVFL
ncbi:hypothetical protein [Pseudomonas sp. RT6P73]